MRGQRVEKIFYNSKLNEISAVPYDFRTKLKLKLINKNCWPFSIEENTLKFPPQSNSIKQLSLYFNQFYTQIYKANLNYQENYSSFDISFKLRVQEDNQKWMFNLKLDINKASILLYINSVKNLGMMTYKLRIKEEEILEYINSINNLIPLITLNENGNVSLTKSISLATIKKNNNAQINELEKSVNIICPSIQQNIFVLKYKNENENQTKKEKNQEKDKVKKG